MKITKGQEVTVKLAFFEGNPKSKVTAHGDSWYNEEYQREMFSFLMEGDMMMIAEFIDNEWISD